MIGVTEPSTSDDACSALRLGGLEAAFVTAVSDMSSVKICSPGSDRSEVVAIIPAKSKKPALPPTIILDKVFCFITDGPLQDWRLL